MARCISEGHPLSAIGRRGTGWNRYKYAVKGQVRWQLPYIRNISSLTSGQRATPAGYAIHCRRLHRYFIVLPADSNSLFAARLVQRTRINMFRNNRVIAGRNVFLSVQGRKRSVFCPVASLSLLNSPSIIFKKQFLTRWSIIFFP